jgi:hypothetical protein
MTNDFPVTGGKAFIPALVATDGEQAVWRFIEFLPPTSTPKLD